LGVVAVTVNVPGVGGEEATIVAAPLELATAVPTIVFEIRKVTTAPAPNPVALNVRDAPAVVVGVVVVSNGVAGGYAPAGETWETPNAHVANTAVNTPRTRFIMPPQSRVAPVNIDDS